MKIYNNQKKVQDASKEVWTPDYDKKFTMIITQAEDLQIDTKLVKQREQEIANTLVCKYIIDL